MSAARQSRAGASAASEQQKKIIAGAVFGVLLLGVLYYELADVFFTPTPPPAAPPVILSGPSPAATANIVGPSSSGAPAATPAHAAVNSSAALDPTLHMQAMLVTEAVLYTGAGRNIFSTSAAAPPAALIPLPKVTGPIRPSGATVPAYTPPTGPPPPPPIDLKFFGLATSPGGRRQAFLLHGDDVFLAANGDIVLRKYRIVAIGPNSVQVEDLTNNNKQTLPLLVTP